MKLKVFYHVVDLPGWESILEEQISRIYSSNLLAHAQLVINFNYEVENYTILKRKLANLPNTEILFREGTLKADYEHPTAILLQQDCMTTSEEFYILYLHMKGITYVGRPNEINVTHWRWLQDHFAITRWQDCIQKLDEGYDAVGVNLTPRVHKVLWKHFSGNVWWTKASFIRRCNVLQLPSDLNFESQVSHDSDGASYRMDIEAWLGANNPKMFSMYDSEVNHYHQPYPPERYVPILTIRGPDEPMLYKSGKSAWGGHLEFGMDLVKALKPKLIVELGVFYGDSYFAFCQAVDEANLDCVCIGIDSWQGDEHAGYYQNDVYERVAAYNNRYSFSTLMRTTFDEAKIVMSNNKKINLLHMDGHHTYESVSHDFNAWKELLADNAIVLFHDTEEDEKLTGFGVGRLFNEIRSEYDYSYLFHHSHGLGILYTGVYSDLSQDILSVISKYST